jgi:Trm5-related predicted tRNA methylase
MGRSYLELFDKDKLVYLTADSPNVLSKIEADKVYIIGGIVDHNRLKNATFKKAEVGALRESRHRVCGLRCSGVGVWWCGV